MFILNHTWETGATNIDLIIGSTIESYNAQQIALILARVVLEKFLLPDEGKSTISLSDDFKTLLSRKDKPCLKIYISKDEKYRHTECYNFSGWVSREKITGDNPEDFLGDLDSSSAKFDLSIPVDFIEDKEMLSPPYRTIFASLNGSTYLLEFELDLLKVNGVVVSLLFEKLEEATKQLSMSLPAKKWNIHVLPVEPLTLKQEPLPYQGQLHGLSPRYIQASYHLYNNLCYHLRHNHSKKKVTSITFEGSSLFVFLDNGDWFELKVSIEERK